MISTQTISTGPYTLKSVAVITASLDADLEMTKPLRRWTNTRRVGVDNHT